METVFTGSDGVLYYVRPGTAVWSPTQFHRIDGPAIITPYGRKEWYLDGKHMEFQEWKREVRKYYETDEDYLLMLLKLD